tara:strand:- start:407 stop:676 length:270 start_codon:yes stop_codon:yes gene_type:complete
MAMGLMSLLRNPDQIQEMPRISSKQQFLQLAASRNASMANLGWPIDLSEEDKILILQNMMNWDERKGPNPFLNPDTGMPALMQLKLGAM